MKTKRLFNPACMIGVLFIYLSILSVSADETGITLQDVIEKAVAADLGVQAQSYKQARNEARIREIGYRGGWDFFIQGQQYFHFGDRLEGRDTSLGRSAQSIHDDLNEDEWRVKTGLKNSFFGPAKDRQADIALERLDQLDREVDIHQEQLDAAFEAAEAYLSIVEGAEILPRIEKQVEYAAQIRNVLASRAEKGETLRADVLEIEYDLAQLRQKSLRVSTKTQRELDFLGRLLNRPDLSPEDLTSPSLPGAKHIETLAVDQLIQEAYLDRPDLISAQEALQAATDFVRRHAKILPDVDIEFSMSYQEQDRDFADETRKDEYLELGYQAEVSFPLSIHARNRALRQRYQAEAEARRLKLQSLYAKVEREIRKSYESYQLSLSEHEVLEARLAHAEEQERVVELTIQQLPEILGTSPEMVVYRARARVLEARSDLLRADHQLRSDLLRLLSETHLLLKSSLSHLSPQEQGGSS